MQPEVSNPLADHYRCLPDVVSLASPGELTTPPGFFNFGPSTVCYGQSTCFPPPSVNGEGLADLSQLEGSVLSLPFDASAILDNLRLERYPISHAGALRAVLSSEAVREVYYELRPFLPDSLRRRLQRTYFRGCRRLPFPRWPVDTSVERTLERILLLSMKTRNLERVPFIWFWPNGAPAAAIVTHDVETVAGLGFVPQLLDIDDDVDIKTSFQLVPEERYPVPRGLLDQIRRRQCEVNVHGFNHDGNLFRDRKTFLKQSREINRYLKDFGAEGFRSACMYRNVDWYHELDMSYDMSVPNVAHLEPQRGGCCTVFPYFIGNILELPLTCIQDYSLFHILGEYSIDLWKRQIELIMARHGLISFIVHPDYIRQEKALSVYKDLLAYASDLRTQKNVWVARPGEVNRWWRERSTMKLVAQDGRWRIEGQGHERARIAFAHVKGDQVVYSIEAGSEANGEPVASGALPIAAFR
jgi:hypothetical protein